MIIGLHHATAAIPHRTALALASPSTYRHCLFTWQIANYDNRSADTSKVHNSLGNQRNYPVLVPHLTQPVPNPPFDEPLILHYPPPPPPRASEYPARPRGAERTRQNAPANRPRNLAQPSPYVDDARIRDDLPPGDERKVCKKEETKCTREWLCQHVDVLP